MIDITNSTAQSRKAIQTVLHSALGYAILAPSSHNTQPWLFKIKDSSIELYADKSRSLKVIDPEDRSLIMSCGAALYNLRLALRNLGYAENTEVLPDSGSPDFLANVTLTGTTRANLEEKQLFEIIPQRHTNRQAFEDAPLPDALISSLQLAAKLEGAELLVSSDITVREHVAQLVAEGDRIQLADPHFRKELIDWTNPNRSKSKDGIPGYALGLSDIASYISPLIVRTFDTGKGKAARDRMLAEGSPAIAILYTKGDTLHEWILAGQALCKILLLARTQTVHASFLNQPIEVPELRIKLSEVLSLPGIAHTILRLGYAREEKPSTPRRDVSEVIK